MSVISATEIFSTAPSVTSIPATRKRIAEPMRSDWELVDGSLSDIKKAIKHVYKIGGVAGNMPVETAKVHHSFTPKVLAPAILFTLGAAVAGQPTSIATAEFVSSKLGAMTMYRRNEAEIESEDQSDSTSWLKFLTSSLAVPALVYQVEERSQKLQSATADFLDHDVVRHAHTKLLQLQSYQNGWHGPRSMGADDRSFAQARQFLRLMSGSEALISVEPTIFSLGTAVLEIETESAAMLLEFQADGTLLANVNSADGEYDYDITDFSGAGLPIQLAKYF